jgi:hypothetical protein
MAFAALLVAFALGGAPAQAGEAVFKDQTVATQNQSSERGEVPIILLSA